MMSHSKSDIPTRAHRRPNPPRRLRFSFFTSAILTAFLFFESPTHAKNGGWDLEPYHIQVAIAIDLPGGLAEQLASELPRYLQRRIDASLAPAWASDVHIATGESRAKILTAIGASDPPLPDVPK